MNVPVRIVAVAFFTESVLPATGVGTIPPPAVVRLSMPCRRGSSVIVPMLVVFKNTPSIVPAGRFTLDTSTRSVRVTVFVPEANVE